MFGQLANIFRATFQLFCTTICRNLLLDKMKQNTMCKVTSELMNVISKMECVFNPSFYPQELYQTIKDEYGVVDGEQQDIHETFTLLCSAGTQNMNDIIASQFESGCQYRKTCTECLERKGLLLVYLSPSQI